MQNLPVLCFLPVANLLIHEHHDDQRCQPLILRIRSSGVWRNPPIVSPLMDGTDRYMVLDGANRITALRQMGFPHALVQIVQPDDSGLTLQTWNHVIWEYHAARFLQNIHTIPSVELHRVDPAFIEPGLEAECGLALVTNCRGRTYSVCTEVMDLELRVDVLNALVDSYKERGRLDRTTVRDVSDIQDVFPGLCGLVIFPTFDIRDLLRLAGRGYLLPAGVTRFMIAPRVLHLNYPLDELSADRPLDAKNLALTRWIQERLARKAIRYYAEPTYLFDE
jgi:hypothetical protein